MDAKKLKELRRCAEAAIQSFWTEAPALRNAHSMIELLDYIDKLKGEVGYWKQKRETLLAERDQWREKKPRVHTVSFGVAKGKCSGCGEVKGLIHYVNDGRSFCQKCLCYSATHQGETPGLPPKREDMK